MYIYDKRNVVSRELSPLCHLNHVVISQEQLKQDLGMSGCGVEHILKECSFLATYMYSSHGECGVFVPRDCRGLLSWQLTRSESNEMKNDVYQCLN